MAENRQQNPDDEKLPGAVSNQNSEEQPTEAGDQTEGRRHPREGESDDRGNSPGAAGEGSQSTGHPSNAG